MSEINKVKNIIEVRGVSFSYGENEVLRDITITVPSGDYLGMIGPNGAGKTTLLKIMLGLLAPSSGSVKLFGEDIKHFKQWSKIGYVPQKATSFDINFPATVFEVALMGTYSRRGLFRITTSKDRQVVREALLQVGMWEYKDRLVGDLSGGQQQRVFIARALATKPEIILLDEPTVGVDQKTSEEFYALLKKLNEELNLTLVLISHDVDMVAKEVKHIACINKSLVCYNLPEEFSRDTQSGKIVGGDIKIVDHEH